MSESESEGWEWEWEWGVRMLQSSKRQSKVCREEMNVYEHSLHFASELLHIIYIDIEYSIFSIFFICECCASYPIYLFAKIRFVFLIRALW